MELMFLGATGTVTGSKCLLTVNSSRILIDCGLYQGYKDLRLRNWNQFPVDPQTIDAVVLTHAHLDHTGYLPVLVKNGFKGKIYCTQGTKDLCAILLPDSGYIQEEDARRANKYGYSKHKPALPLYTRDEAIQIQNRFSAMDFNSKFTLYDGLTVEFLPAGHIIGASLVRLEAQGKTIVFTGDLGRPHDPLMRPPVTVTSADYLIAESTYGDRLHGSSDPLEQLSAVIQKTIARGGSVLIPAFAVGRTQDILYYIYQLKQKGLLSGIPVFLDSPMAENVSDLLARYSGEHKLDVRLSKEVCKTAKYITTPEESKTIDQYNVPVIIISASGMMEGGRVLHHMRNFLPHYRNTLILTGYQAGGTRGDRLLRKESQIKIHGEMITVKAEVVAMDNMSAHADYQEMLDWLKNFKRAPRKVFLNHGEMASALTLKNKIEEEFGWVCEIPEYLKVEKL